MDIERIQIKGRFVSTDTRIAVVGLGYVGLPLALEFGKRYPTTGYDTDGRRIAQLREGIDRTGETEPGELAAVARLSFSDRLEDIRDAVVYIVTVPTPVDPHNRPDLSALSSASEAIGCVLKKGDVVIYESTVYPGATEEHCVPVLEKSSGLVFNRDFSVGYSPERINPGDREHRLTSVVKITSGSTPEAARFVDALYASIITAGTHRASSIKVAEAAKVIENTQRDLNVALMNELAILFRKMDLDTEEVLDAAGTKWNFMPFRPGLVGGHCIGVDPYYLTFAAEALGYHPQVILAGRRINDRMGGYIVGQLVKAMIHSRIQVENANVLVMGLSFKENCPDMRNSKVFDSIRELVKYNMNVDVYDPWIDADDARREYGIHVVEQPVPGKYDAIILAVSHRQFRELGANRVREFGKASHVLFDVKCVLPRHGADLRL
ncbi:MAG: Vi polysaccharide biosynthesis UDP-N-acetylglucosamine dehydrogenase TviB [Paucimonas sp.]|nr:Vi polysaccharide biosynthesis UDP-N-acetylglucosamine dehydrogenase TviB [Paucimonas sp.]